MKKARRGFAIGSSQRNRMTLMFGAARFWRSGLNASPGFGFPITPRGDRAARRRTCCASASINDGFKTQRGRASRDAAQALQATRFFTSVGAPKAANCLQFAATRLKFAA
jgi:hypothetical protein